MAVWETGYGISYFQNLSRPRHKIGHKEEVTDKGNTENDSRMIKVKQPVSMERFAG